MRYCVTCGDPLPPLNGVEENDFRFECEYCIMDEEVYVDDEWADEI